MHFILSLSNKSFGLYFATILQHPYCAAKGKKFPGCVLVHVCLARECLEVDSKPNVVNTLETYCPALKERDSFHIFDVEDNKA